MDVSLKNKLEDLRRRIRRLDSALIPFSGGVDSAFLMRVCRDELGEKAVAVTTYAANYPHSELVMAKRIAKILGVQHVVYEPSGDERGKAPAHRGANFYSSLKSLAMRMKLKSVIDTCHGDDVDKDKHFIEAKRAGVSCPLLESQLTKAEIRVLAKELGLPSWDKCPPSGNARPVGRLSKALIVKEYLASLGVKDTYVRMGGKKLTLLSGKRDIALLVKHMDAIRRKMRSLGFSEVLLEAA